MSDEEGFKLGQNHRDLRGEWVSRQPNPLPCVK